MTAAIFLFAFVVLFVVWLKLRPERALRVASGLTSHVICSQTFCSGQDPARIYAEVVAVHFAGFASLVRYRVDREKRQVTTKIAGLFGSTAVYREGWGSLLVRGKLPAPHSAPWLIRPAPAEMENIRRELDPVLAQAFAEDANGRRRHTQGVLVLHRGHIVAERYASGFDASTPIHGWSCTKAVVNALIGILARQGRVGLNDTHLFPAWCGQSDPRAQISIEHLLRQTSGLDLAWNRRGLDPSARMMFAEHDMAAFAQAAPAAHPPGRTWAYIDANYQLLSRLIRDAAGGSGEAALRLAHDELFEPLGMHGATFECDATGTPLGSGFMLAPLRAWARLGQLYLDSGMAGARRILPEGWVDYSVRPTLDTGYGAGFFTNRIKGGDIPNWGAPWDMPHAPDDTFYARGYMGQYVVIVPSAELVVVRMGPSHVAANDIESVGALVADAIRILNG